MAKSYCPSNGSEGIAFEDGFCNRCRSEASFRKTQHGGGCKIHLMALAFGTGDPQYPAEWIYDDNDNPTCTAFVDEKYIPAANDIARRERLETAGQETLFRGNGGTVK